MRESIEEQIQPTRRRILETLKRDGCLTADELSDRLGITSMGIRRHLTTLERDGLVTYDVVQRGMGRPSYLYRLTHLADELFPKTYPQLTNELLRYMEELDGPERIAELFSLRGRRRLEGAIARFGDREGADRLEKLLSLLNEEGYMAELHDDSDGSFTLVEYNCPIKQVADKYGYACKSELRFFEDFLAADVVREQHLASGDHCCAYHIQFTS